MAPSLGWTLLSRDALKRAETLAQNDVQGVRDEIGFLALHQAYADRFFPGTSVLHTRLRYVLFVPWIYQGLIKDGVRERVAESINQAELNLVGQLRMSGESGIIGKENYPKTTTQPPCLVYWSVLGKWRVLRAMADGSYPQRSVIHRRLGRPGGNGKLKDDDKQLMQEDQPLFASLPQPPKSWGKKTEPLDFRLLAREKKFLSNMMLALRRPDSNERSLLSRMVEADVQLGPQASMWSGEVEQLADDADRAALVRARQAASLSAIGRGVYAALVEDLRAVHDGVESRTKNRDALEHLIGEHGHDGLKLNVAKIQDDAAKMDAKILEVLDRTQTWLRRGNRDVSELYQVYCDAESKRKDKRARLPKTLFAREKRLEWSPEEHPSAQPLHYRWDVARSFLRDLTTDENGGDDE